MEEEELVKEIEEACSKEEAKSFKKISKMVNPKIESYFKKLEDYIDILRKSKKVNSLFVVSPPGLGKTTYLLYFLMKAGLKPIQDFVLINTHSSPLSLYAKMYDNKSKILIFDDMPRLFRDELSKNIFLSALWSPTDTRVVNWNSIITTGAMGLPKKFVFEGKCIVLLNKIPNEMDAIKSRCLNYNILFARKDMIDLMREISTINKINPEVVDFIENNTDVSHELSLRTLTKMNEIYKTSLKWKEIGMEQLEVNEEIKIILKLMAEKKPIKEQIREFTDASGLSRRSYFYYKRLLKQRQRGFV